MELLSALDFGILNSIQSIHGEILSRIMTLVTYLGSSALPWLAAALVLVLKRGSRKHGLVILFSMVIGLLFGSVILKHVVLRERPFNNPAAIFNAAELLIPPPLDRYSFPSSHSVTSFAAATAIFFRHKGFGAAAFALAALIAFSRLYFYVHFPTDVLAGALIGVLCAIAVKKAADFIQERRETNTAA